MTMDDFIENLRTYELKKYQDRDIVQIHKDNNPVLKNTKNLGTDDDDMAVLTHRSQKMIRKGGFQKKR